ncbi:MAG: cation diffusion facilitator family transporter [Clostridiaceae bacterium]
MENAQKLKPVTGCDNSEGFRIAEKYAKIGVASNIILTLMKAVAGVLGGSQAMIAEAMHSAADFIATVIVYISLKIAKKPADEKHPFGYGKAEVVSSAIVGVMLLGAGVLVLKTAYDTIMGGASHTPGVIALYASIISMVVKEFLYRITYKAAVKVNSPSTMANAMDHRSDVFATFATFIGIGGAILGFPIMDPLAGAVVALFILKMGWDIIVDAVNQIMDKSPGDQIVLKVKDIILNTPGVKDAHDIRVRQSGPYYLVSFDICVDCSMNLTEAHVICEDVRGNIFNEMDQIYEVRVHIDPHLCEI